MTRLQLFGKTLVAGAGALMISTAAQAQGIGSDSGQTGIVDRGGVPGSARSTTELQGGNGGACMCPIRGDSASSSYNPNAGERDAGNHQANSYNERNRR